jgi:hypothetical protein
MFGRIILRSDLLVFHAPKQDSVQEDALIVARVVSVCGENGTVYFRTKRDGEGVHVWPEMPDVKECDRWYDYRGNYTLNGMISERLLVGRVVLRVPWVGYFVFFVTSSYGIVAVVAVVIVVAIAWFAVSKFRRRKNTVASTSETS